MPDFEMLRLTGGCQSQTQCFEITRQTQHFKIRHQTQHFKILCQTQFSDFEMLRLAGVRCNVLESHDATFKIFRQTQFSVAMRQTCIMSGDSVG